MPVLSVLRRTFPPVQSLCRSWQLNGTTLQVRKAGGGPRKMEIIPSSFSWHQFKDYLHFYLMVGVIPLTLLVTYVNIFIGPAELREIPEGYIPEKWEYYKHPICRWYARYIYPSHQEEYEKYLHILYQAEEARMMNKIEKQVKTAMKINMDSTANYWYRPPVTKYMMGVRKEFEEEEREYVMSEE